MDYLYHYTSLSALALILKNKTIRLNSLKNFDDAEEVMTENSNHIGKYCMVSSWTEIDSESIPLWGLYTDRMTGIRLRLKKNPFETTTVSLEYYFSGKEFTTCCPAQILKDARIWYDPSIPFLRKVEYTEEDSLIYTDPIKVLQKNEDGRYQIIGDFKDINRYKRSSWEFQKEWRYSLFFLPRDKNGNLKLDLSKQGNDMPFWYCDLKIAKAAFENIEIMTGPKMNEGDKILLKELVKTYCPKAKILASQLRIN